MIWHLFAVLIMAVCGGGLAFGLRKLTRGRVPKWLIPASAAAGMLGYLAYYDYDWYAFKLSQLPADAQVVAEQRDTSFFKPWRYVVPAVSGFTVLDGKHVIREQGGERLVEYIEYRFRADPVEGMDLRAFVLNCQTLERVPFDPEKGQIGSVIEKISTGDAIYQQACR